MPLLKSAIIAVGCAVALVSAIGGARVTVPQLEAWKDRYGALRPSQRENEVARSLGFDVSAWERLRRSVSKGDRYVIVATALEQHEVRNYAAYALLPAIQVASVEEANVVVYYATDPPRGSSCRRIGGQMCVEGRAGA